MILVDDLTETAGTLVGAAGILREQGLVIFTLVFRTRS